MIEEIMALREQESFRYRDVAILTANMERRNGAQRDALFHRPKEEHTCKSGRGYDKQYVRCVA